MVQKSEAPYAKQVPYYWQGGEIGMSVDISFDNLKILTSARWEPWQKEAILKIAPSAILLEPETDGTLEELILESDILFGSTSLPPTSLSKSPTLKLVHVLSTGVDRYMVPEFKDSPIVLVNSRGVHGSLVADHAMALLLALSRSLNLAYENQKQKNWARLPIVDLEGKTAGLLGLGAIGREVAARCKAFRMRVIAMKRTLEDDPLVEKVYLPSALKELLAESDFVICSLPLTEETYHMLTIKEFATMKPSSFFVNVGRGAVVKEEDLITALMEGKLKGAGLDVFEKEPLDSESPLWDMSNVLITAHYAGTDQVGLRKSFSIFLDNLVRLRNGEPLVNVVNKELGY